MVDVVCVKTFMNQGSLNDWMKEHSNIEVVSSSQSICYNKNSEKEVWRLTLFYVEVFD